MVEWQSPEVQEMCLFVYSQVTVFSLGVLIWYLILTFPEVELGLLMGRLRFKLAHAPYLLSRYSQLTTLIMVVILSRTGKPFTCAEVPFVRGLAVNGNLAIASASSNLGIRAMAIWSHKRHISMLIALLCVMHITFAIALGICGVKDEWNSTHTICTVIQDTVKYGLFSFFLTTICLDISILLLTIRGLRSQKRNGSVSPLWKTLVTQGIAYAAITCITSIPMAVLTRLNLNYSMNMIFIIPGSTISVMASSTVVTLLLRMNDHETEDWGSLSQHSAHADLPPTNRKEYISSNQFSTHISLTSLNYRNSGEIDDSRFDLNVLGESSKSIGMSEPTLVHTSEHDFANK